MIQWDRATVCNGCESHELGISSKITYVNENQLPSFTLPLISFCDAHAHTHTLCKTELFTDSTKNTNAEKFMILIWFISSIFFKGFAKNTGAEHEGRPSSEDNWWNWYRWIRGYRLRRYDCTQTLTDNILEFYKLITSTWGSLQKFCNQILLNYWTLI